MISYGSFIWWKGTTSAMAQKALCHLQRVVCMAITGAAKSAPQVALETLLNIPPLDKFITAEAQITAFRLRTIINLERVRHYNHSNAIERLYSYEPFLQAPSDRNPPALYFEKPYRVILPTREAEMMEERPTVTQIDRWFTDTSVNIFGSGYGFWNESTDTEYCGYLGLYADISQAELSAILNCSIEIANDNLSTSPIVIHTESLYAIKALNDFKVDTKLVLDCITLLTQIAQRREVTLKWISPQTQTQGQMRAAILAKKGASQRAYGPEPFLPWNERKCRNICNKWLQESIIIRWRNTNTCSTTRSFLTTPSKKIASQLLSLSKMKLSYTIGILTGHIRLNAHLKRIGVRDDPDCDLCGRNEETSIHFLCTCTQLDRTRVTIFGKGTINPEEVLKFDISKIFSFIKESGLPMDANLTKVSSGADGGGSGASSNWCVRAQENREKSLPPILHHCNGTAVAATTANFVVVRATLYNKDRK
ncbi:uncharacterized protein LOC116336812 [Contarinia nasturtii]|uniref:uncharacterized protein LOC116336812 n=1 Tax=Contarinia nasturtii TaxID=265458 RepID=UPI0012D4A082|nr:uncharacterized protein LOC116336812 [Contarinia nasturtii]